MLNSTAGKPACLHGSSTYMWSGFHLQIAMNNNDTNYLNIMNVEEHHSVLCYSKMAWSSDH